MPPTLYVTQNENNSNVKLSVRKSTQILFSLNDVFLVHFWKYVSNIFKRVVEKIHPALPGALPFCSEMSEQSDQGCATPLSFVASVSFRGSLLASPPGAHRAWV